MRRKPPQIAQTREPGPEHPDRRGQWYDYPILQMIDFPISAGRHAEFNATYSIWRNDAKKTVFRRRIRRTIGTAVTEIRGRDEPQGLIKGVESFEFHRADA